MFSTTTAIGTVSAATDAHGVQPTSTRDPLPGSGTYVASVAAAVNATSPVRTVDPVGGTDSPAAAMTCAVSTEVATATGANLRKGRAARA